MALNFAHVFGAAPVSMRAANVYRPASILIMLMSVLLMSDLRGHGGRRPLCDGRRLPTARTIGHMVLSTALLHKRAR
jgi:hypothetical protein